MSRPSPTAGRSEPIALDVRPLPSAPSLEYERKEAKALLKRIHDNDPDALNRVRATHPIALRGRQPEELKLADAQHLIAREYGFTSWPRLVEYFEEVNRHCNAPRFNSSDDLIDHFDAFVQSIMKRHQRGDQIVARELAHYVPRFFARPINEILATPITEGDARLVFAREHRRASWEELLERASASKARRELQRWENPNLPAALVRDAVRNHDVTALAEILDGHPELLSTSVIEREWRGTLAGLALTIERQSQNPDARHVTDLLASRGVDIQLELNERLLGFPQDGASARGGWSAPDILHWYLDRGANPDWMPPNGITVLEHAIGRYMNGTCVDVIAQRVTPRRALWIAAGLGDVAGVRSFIAGNAKLTPEGRINRPDFVAIGAMFERLPPHRDANDLEIMHEAFQVAGWNERWDVMDVLLQAGLPVDYSPFGWPMVFQAVLNLNVPLAEFLISRGTDLDREYPQHGSVRAAARSLVERMADLEDPRMGRLLALCNAGNIEEILAEIDAKRQSPPPPYPQTLRIMQLAADDAARQGAAAVTTEHMLVGILRWNNGQLAGFLAGSGTEMARLHERLSARLLPDSDPLIGQELPADVQAEAAVKLAGAEADARRRDGVVMVHLIYGILSQEDGPGVRLLRDVGADIPQFRERIKSVL